MQRKMIENQIEETLNSINNIRQAKADPYLYMKIFSRIEQKRKEEMISMRFFVGWVFICIIVMTLNLFMNLHFHSIETSYRKTTLQEFASKYFLNDTLYKNVYTYNYLYREKK
jgi:hypothetical protein